MHIIGLPTSWARRGSTGLFPLQIFLLLPAICCNQRFSRLIFEELCRNLQTASTRGLIDSSKFPYGFFPEPPPLRAACVIKNKLSKRVEYGKGTVSTYKVFQWLKVHIKKSVIFSKQIKKK